ncbi:transcriptional regulator, DeoR family [Streptomyces azureus]|uniref:Transcriptional regulator, DeoR family n=1 Tax=Streptomyces azureus TaxID=146537 RepID=A0A0K8PPM6_STRAJ|nr:transcriptional regulator, DeoR family [Streptomyces azureus]
MDGNHATPQPSRRHAASGTGRRNDLGAGDCAAPGVVGRITPDARHSLPEAPVPPSFEPRERTVGAPVQVTASTGRAFGKNGQPCPEAVAPGDGVGKGTAPDFVAGGCNAHCTKLKPLTLPGRRDPLALFFVPEEIGRE